jgi:hypothetical protein
VNASKLAFLATFSVILVPASALHVADIAIFPSLVAMGFGTSVVYIAALSCAIRLPLEIFQGMAFTTVPGMLLLITLKPCSTAVAVALWKALKRAPKTRTGLWLCSSLICFIDTFPFSLAATFITYNTLFLADSIYSFGISIPGFLFWNATLPLTSLALIPAVLAISLIGTFPASAVAWRARDALERCSNRINFEEKQTRSNPTDILDGQEPYSKLHRRSMPHAC